MCSMLDVHALWSDSLCCGPSGSRRKCSVTSTVGGSKSAGTNVGFVMAGMALTSRWPPFIGSRVADHTLPAMRPEEPRIVSRSHQFGGAALDEPRASGRVTGRVTLGSVLHGLRVELRPLLEAYHHTPRWLWFAIGGASLGVACLGLLPIGAWSF